LNFITSSRSQSTKFTSSILPFRKKRERVESEKMAAPFSLIFFLLFTICVTSTSSMQTFFPRATYYFTSLSQANSPKPKMSYKTQYFPQQLDHFTFQPNSYKIFYQKYLINNHYWQHGAPIFVYTGNEGDIEWFAANTGFLLDIAPKFRALLVFIEVMFPKTQKSLFWMILRIHRNI
jgi:lysosomal Pro-X carboxypeptidase